MSTLFIFVGLAAGVVGAVVLTGERVAVLEGGAVVVAVVGAVVAGVVVGGVGEAEARVGGVSKRAAMTTADMAV